MADKKANEAHFFFQVTDHDKTAFQVADFTGLEQISSPYKFNIRLLEGSADNSQLVDPDTVINKNATLYLYRQEKYYCYSGIISEFQFIDKSTDAVMYAATLVPRLSLLELNKQTRVFQKMAIPDIVTQVLDDAGLSGFYQTNLSGTYPEQEYVVQYQESDLQFISRLMEYHGIWYFFEEAPITESTLKDDFQAGGSGNPGNEKIIISDQPADFVYIPDESNIGLYPRSGFVEKDSGASKESIKVFHKSKKVIPAELTLRNFNYLTPESPVSAQKSLATGTVGSVYEYGGDFKDTTEAQNAADIIANEIASSQEHFSGTGNCAGFKAGSRFTLVIPPPDDSGSSEEIKLLLTSVAHRGNQYVTDVNRASEVYNNNFSSIPAEAAENYRPPRRANVPRINGVITAKIEANGGDYASLDDKGRYKVRLPFDLSDAANSEASKYVRLAQPYSGANYGIHFPSHEDTEMILACIQGDPNKPIGLGTVPNANTISPVVSNNKEQSIIRTAGNNELLMDDTEDAQKIHLVTNAANILEMDDGEKRVFLQSTDGNQLLLDDNNEMSTWKAGEHNVQMNYAGGSEAITITTAGGHVIKIDDANKVVNIQTSGGNAIELDDNGKKISMTDANGKNTVTLDGSSGLVLESQGKISIKATQDVEIEGANIKMSTTSGKIEAKATQDLNLSGMKISGKASAGDVLFEGLNVGLTGKMKATMESNLGTEISSSLQTKIGGTMTELAGDAMTTVKGGIVMIN